MRAQPRVDRLDQMRHAERDVDEGSVDEERPRPAGAAQAAPRDVLVDPLPVDPVAKPVVEALEIELDPRG